MKNMLINHHAGMGDFIVNNGLVRKFAEDYPDYHIYLLGQKQYLENINFMYRDNEMIKTLPLADKETEKFLANTKFDKNISIDLSVCKYNYRYYVDDAFYLCAGLNPEIKTTHFKLDRDYDREISLYNEIINEIGTDEFNFVHGGVNPKRIDNDFPWVHASIKYKMFDLLFTIEKAREVHVISSSFLSLLTVKKYNTKSFAHMYAGRSELSPYIEKCGITVLL